LGFLGSNLSRALVEQGAKVTVIDNFLSGHGANLFNINGIEDKIRVVKEDICNSPSLSRLVKESDIIFNLAAQVSHIDSISNPLKDYEINILGNLKLLEACRDSGTLKKIIYAGTRSQYGEVKEFPVTHDTPRLPLDFYSVHKDTAERLHFIYSSLFDLRVISLRINNVFGPRHQMQHSKYGVLNWFIRLALDGQVIKIFGDGAQLRDYTYVDDITCVFLLLGEKDQALGNAFNVGSGDSIKFRDMARKIVELVGSGRIETIPWPEGYKNIEVGDYSVDISKLKALGWEPKIGFEEGLKKTIDFYRKYKDHYW
jgi:UDP-glucose 4-epimerase